MHHAIHDPTSFIGGRAMLPAITAACVKAKANGVKHVQLMMCKMDGHAQIICAVMEFWVNPENKERYIDAILKSGKLAAGIRNPINKVTDATQWELRNIDGKWPELIAKGNLYL